MIAYLSILFLGCSTHDPMKERAENAALVCYDNGLLVYASETTTSELSEIVKEQNSCIEKYNKEANEYNAGWKERMNKFLIPCIMNDPMKERAKECGSNFRKSEADGFPKNTCNMNALAPDLQGEFTSFDDKGTIFETYTLKCLAKTK